MIMEGVLNAEKCHAGPFEKKHSNYMGVRKEERRAKKGTERSLLLSQRKEETREGLQTETTTYGRIRLHLMLRRGKGDWGEVLALVLDRGETESSGRMVKTGELKRLRRGTNVRDMTWEKGDQVLCSGTLKDYELKEKEGGGIERFRPNSDCILKGFLPIKREKRAYRNTKGGLTS